MTACYSANLAASLTIKKFDNKIESAEDLLKQKNLQFGTLGKGFAYHMLKNSDYELFTNIAAAIEENNYYLKVESKS